MSPKKFIFYLSDENIESFSSSGAQVILTLQPVGIPGLFSTAHPVVWKIFDLFRDHHRIFHWNSDLAFSTFTKNPESCIMPNISRVVPIAHHTALMRGPDGQAQWSVTRRYHLEYIDSVIATNLYPVPSAFALNTVAIKEDEYEASCLPIMAFNRIPKDRSLITKASLTLQAFSTLNRKPCQTLRKEHLQKPLCENDRPWSVNVDDLPPVSWWCISRRYDGTICISQSENDHSIYGGLGVGNRKDVAALQQRIETLSQELRHAVGDDLQGIRSLLIRIHKAEEFINNNKQHITTVGQDTHEMHYTLMSGHDVRGIPTPVDRMQELVSKIKDIEATIMELGGLQSTVAALHTKMQNVDKSSEAQSRFYASVASAISRVEGSVATISGDNNELTMKYRELMANIMQIEDELIQLQQTHTRNVASLKADMAVTADDFQLRVQKVEGSLRATNMSVQQLDQGVSDVKDSLQKLHGEVDKKPTTEDNRKIHEAHKQLARQVGGVERSLATAGKTLHSLNAKVEEVTSVNEARTVAIEVKVSGTQNALQTMGTRINSTLTSIETTAGKVSALHSQVNEAAGRITATETRITQMDGHVGKLEGETRKVGDELKSTNATVLQTLSGMNGISKRVTVVEQAMQGVRAKFTELEEKESRLQAEVHKAANTKVWHATYWK